MPQPKKISISISYEEDGTTFKNTTKKVIKVDAPLGKILQELEAFEIGVTGQAPLIPNE